MAGGSEDGSRSLQPWTGGAREDGGDGESAGSASAAAVVASRAVVVGFWAVSLRPK